MLRTAIPLLFVLTSPLLAQAPSARLHGETEGAQTRKRLVEAQAKLTAGKTADAIDDLLRVLADSGDDLVQLADGSHQPARRLVHRSLAGLPPDALKGLRDRIDEPARKLYEAGRAARDPKPLRALLDRYFVSRSAEPALLLLGELAFERGEFAAAERYWRTLLPPASDTALSFPQPATDPAAVRARAILAAIFGGEIERAAAEWQEFQAKHPAAAGRLAGTDGKYADTLAKLLAAPPTVPADADGWTTLGGNPHRDGRAARPIPRHIPNQPKWKTPIPRDAADQDRPKPAGVPPARTLAHHPVAMAGTAYLADAGRVFAFDLRTGAARVAFDVRTHDPQLALDPSELAKPTPFDADFVLTVAGGKLYARLGTTGPPTTAAREDGKKPLAFLFEFEPNGPLALKPTWAVSPPVKDGVPAVWEGAPLVVDGLAVAAFTRLENSRRVHAVAAYRLPSVKPLWVAEASDEDANQTEGFPYRHELLTLAGGNAVYATHAGLTVAFDVATGKRAWAFRNPPAARPPAGGSPRDLCPPVAHGGRVFLAPADGDRVYALDAETGAKLWDSGPVAVQVDYLLGVSRNRLVAALHGPGKGLRGYAVTDGRNREPTGWQTGVGVASFGRGLLSEDLILWPNASSTAGKLDLLDPRDGDPAGPVPLPGPHGNLAFAEGVLLVATPTELWGYIPDPSQLSPTPAPVARPWVKVERTPFRAVELVPTPRTEFDPLAAPALPQEAVAKEFALPAAAWPIRPLADGPELPGLVSRDASAERRFFATDSRTLFAVQATDGRTLWETPLEPPTAFTYGLMTTNGKVILTGPDAVGCFDAKSGREKWRFALPEFPVAAVALAGSRVVVLLGEHAILALDLESGKPAWQLDSQLRSRLTLRALDSTPAFVPHMLGTPRAVYALRTDGTRVVIDPDMGAATATTNQTVSEWAGPPVADGTRVILPDGPLRLLARSEVTGESEWVREFPGETSGTGRAPAVRLADGALLAAVHRSYGVELHHLDPATGKAHWANPPILPADALDLAALDADRDRLYVPVGTRLLAFDKTNGREAWSRELPGDGWRVRVGRAGVIAYSPNARPQEPLATVSQRLAWRLIENPRRAVGLLATLVEAVWNRTVPVVLFEAETGEVRKRWDVPTAGPVVGVHFSGELSLVASVGTATRLTK